MLLSRLSTRTVFMALALCGAWLGLIMARPSLATNMRVAIILNTLSAYLFVVYCCTDPDLTSTKRYIVSQIVPGYSGKTVGVTFLGTMAVVYLWMSWNLASKLQLSVAA